MGELLEVSKLVTLSTAHLSPATVEKLPSDAAEHTTCGQRTCWWPTFTRDEGWMFYLPADEVAFNIVFEKAPKDLLDVLIYVRNSGCEWCLFDCDGPTCDALYEYDW